MVVVMLAAEDPSADGPSASTPRRGMDCTDKSNTAAKKLVQARLPFKRLNPEPKESREPKRTRGAPAPPCPEPDTSDGENEQDRPSLPLPRASALINGRGPLDGFMSRSKRPPVATPAAFIDLTEDSRSTDGAKGQPAPPPAASCPGEQSGNHGNTDYADDDVVGDISKADIVAPVTDTVMQADMDEGEDAGSDTVDMETTLAANTTLGSETEDDEEQETEGSRGNESLLQSPASTSSLSAVESSPEPSKTTPTAPAAAEDQASASTEQSKAKRRSLKGVQEQEARQRAREERERQREEARAAKERKKEEARKQREEKERERKEKKEREEREKREKKEKDEKEKAEKLRAKEEQRKVKQEAKLEEKRKKEEEKRLKEEKDRIKAEKAEITRFLQKPKTQLVPKTLAAACGKFAPFEIKEHMLLAPLTRVRPQDAALPELDRLLNQQDPGLDALHDWTRRRPRRSGRTTHGPVGSDCVVLVEGQTSGGAPDRRRYGRMKLLHFHENYRPAYWGTWSKRSCLINPRCPLRQDKDLLDYEVDSDEEWEEEEPGESLSHSEGDDDDEAGDDDDDDDGFFVPHGYLSDGEGALEEEESGDPEKQRVRQRLKAREWDELMAKKKLRVLEAVVRGCVWEGEGPTLELLLPYAVCTLQPLPKEEPAALEAESPQKQRNEQLLSQLLPLLHGNVNSSKVIITEFQEFLRQQQDNPPTSPPTRVQLKRLIKQSAVYEKRSAYRRCCWYVHGPVLTRFGCDALPVPCVWSYLTAAIQPSRDPDPPVGAPASQGISPTTPQSSAASTTPSNKRKSTSQSITKYMRRCGDVEQTEAMETDGFQADTEDDEDDGDCVIISTAPGSCRLEEAHSSPAAEEPMDATPSDVPILSAPCPAPTPATA